MYQKICIKINLYVNFSNFIWILKIKVVILDIKWINANLELKIP